VGNLRAAVEAIQAIDPRVPDVALILGSGLGSLADTASNMISIPGAEIPGFPAAGVSGHEGDLVIGDLAGKVVAFFRGRFHKYEGHDIATLTFPVRVAAALGIRRLIVTNAAGSLRPQTSAGSLMRITDHINTTAWDPLLGIKHSGTDNPARGRRPNDGCYDDEWGREADQLALDLGIKLYQGVYAWTLGPSYETPAEIRYFRKIGADAVGMSTVPEVSIASRLGVKVLGFSAITNLGAGLEDVVLSHADVLDVGRSIHGKMKQLLVAILASIPDRDAEPGHE
jgi:purine-nucleoside phosphorylase